MTSGASARPARRRPAPSPRQAASAFAAGGLVAGGLRDFGLAPSPARRRRPSASVTAANAGFTAAACASTRFAMNRSRCLGGQRCVVHARRHPLQQRGQQRDQVLAIARACASAARSTRGPRSVVDRLRPRLALLAVLQVDVLRASPCQCVAQERREEVAGPDTSRCAARSRPCATTVAICLPVGLVDLLGASTGCSPRRPSPPRRGTLSSSSRSSSKIARLSVKPSRIRWTIASILLVQRIVRCPSPATSRARPRRAR